MKTIKIVTPQNVLIEHELASVVLRTVALFLDQIIIILFLVFVFILFEFFNMPGAIIDLMIYVLVIPVYFLYSLLFEAYNYGQTLGKRAIGIKVRRLDGNEVTFTEAVTRWLMRIPDVFISAGSLAAILIHSTERSQRLGDILAGTIVVKQVSNATVTLDGLLKINSSENYTPKYVDVLKLNEEDVVLIKQTIVRYNKYSNVAHKEAISLLAAKLAQTLNIELEKQNEIKFLKTLIKDYIVLTR